MADTPVYDLKNGKPHPFHTPPSSPWPLLCALAAGLLAVCGVLYMHKGAMGSFVFDIKEVIVGFVLLISMMTFWWRDVLREAFVERAHSPITRIGFRYGMALFIASEVMFFVAFFWAFFNFSLFPGEGIGHVWPPKGTEIIHPFDLPFLMTMILLLSGCTVTWAHHALIENHQQEAARALGITVLLGAIFTCLQAWEYHHAAFGFKDSVYSSAFYMATGFHGFHVLVGSIFLAVCWWRTKKGHFTPESHFGFEAAAWYWHFVDVVWLFLFASIYWWGNAGAPH